MTEGDDRYTDLARELLDSLTYVLTQRRSAKASDPLKVDVMTSDAHWYWSTYCRHHRHDECAATVIQRDGGTVPRRPAQCKTCGAPCACDCHRERQSTVEDR